MNNIFKVKLKKVSGMADLNAIRHVEPAKFQIKSSVLSTLLETIGEKASPAPRGKRNVFLKDGLNKDH